jgi:two-component system sensor histidine kinase and response regulator WspE
VVDDDISIRELSAAVLMPSGYQVDTAEDGAAGWEALHGNNYDLLITDHNMPRVSGVELVKKLRSARMALPVVLTSGALPTEELSRNPSLQLAATLLKPFSPDELLGTVIQVLRGSDSPHTRPAIYFPEMTGAVSRIEPLRREHQQ